MWGKGGRREYRVLSPEGRSKSFQGSRKEEAAMRGAGIPGSLELQNLLFALGQELLWRVSRQLTSLSRSPEKLTASLPAFLSRLSANTTCA